MKLTMGLIHGVRIPAFVSGGSVFKMPDTDFSQYRNCD